MTDRIRLECDENKGNMLLRNFGSTTHFYKLHTHSQVQDQQKYLSVVRKLELKENIFLKFIRILNF
jgi:hypothetical protein